MPPHTTASYLVVLWTCSQASFEETETRIKKRLFHGRWLEWCEWYYKELGKLLYCQNGKTGETAFSQLRVLAAALVFVALGRHYKHRSVKKG
jgi:hypothetical protein